MAITAGIYAVPKTSQQPFQQAVYHSPQRMSTHSPSSALDATSASAATPSAPALIEDFETGVARSDRVEAAAMLKLGLGKSSQISPAAFDDILNAAFAVAGSEAMGHILGLCRKWREALVYYTRRDIGDKMGGSAPGQ